MKRIELQTFRTDSFFLQAMAFYFLCSVRFQLCQRLIDNSESASSIEEAKMVINHGDSGRIYFQTKAYWWKTTILLPYKSDANFIVFFFVLLVIFFLSWASLNSTVSAFLFYCTWKRTRSSTNNAHILIEIINSRTQCSFSRSHSRSLCVSLF